MKHVFSTTLLLITLALTFNSASAEVLYSYSGAGPLTEQVSCTQLAIGDGLDGAWEEGDGEFPAGWPEDQLCDELIRPTNGTLKAWFVVDQALTANLALGSANVVSWGIEDGTNTASSGDSIFNLTCNYEECSGDSILLATDEFGNISDWVFIATVDGSLDPVVGDLLGIATTSVIPESSGDYTVVNPQTTADEWRNVYEQYNPDEPTHVYDRSTYLAFDAYYQEPEQYKTFASTERGTWTATVIPVPAAAWLFISALGLLGLRRRR